MNKPLISKAFIANTITAMNIFCGFMSILYASQNNFRYAAIFIITAAIFDTLDGIIARLLDTASRFGVELDSLSDVVSFGAAPSFLIFKAYAFQFGPWGILLSSSLLIFGALRLARFNVMTEEIKTKGDFTGLPIPLAAITIALLIFSYYQDGKIIEPFDSIVAPLIIILSLLMVSRVRYNALPNLKDRKIKEKVFLFGLLIIALVLTIITNGHILFFIFLSIILFGILRHLFYKISGIKNGS
ncbi:MAG: CDP-diacylglycerol--serine O-phosphatidyltransferase [Bacteroidota bacterium]